MQPTWASVFLDVSFVSLVTLSAHLGLIDRATCGGLVIAIIGARVMQIRNGGPPSNGAGPLSGSLVMLLLVGPVLAIVHHLTGQGKSGGRDLDWG